MRKKILILTSVVLLCVAWVVGLRLLTQDKTTLADADTQLLNSIESIHTDLSKTGFKVTEIEHISPLECRSGVFNKRDGTNQRSHQFTLTYSDTAQATTITNIVEQNLGRTQNMSVELMSPDEITNTVDVRAESKYYRVNLTFAFDSRAASVSGATKCL